MPETVSAVVDAYGKVLAAVAVEVMAPVACMAPELAIPKMVVVDWSRDEEEMLNTRGLMMEEEAR